jgi:hypothetical protein
LSFEQFFIKAEGTVEELPQVVSEDANLPCYFTPHFFAVETNDGLFVSNTELTLRQTIALIAELGYNYSNSKVLYSLESIKPVAQVSVEQPALIIEAPKELEFKSKFVEKRHKK